MFQSVRSRVLGLLALLGLSAGLAVTVTEKGCSVTPVEPTTSVPAVNGEGEGEEQSLEQPSDTGSVVPEVVQ